MHKVYQVIFIKSLYQKGQIIYNPNIIWLSFALVEKGANSNYGMIHLFGNGHSKLTLHNPIYYHKNSLYVLGGGVKVAGSQTAQLSAPFLASTADSIKRAAEG